MSVRERLVVQREFACVESEAWVTLVVATEHVTRGTDAVCARYGVTRDQYNVLRILRGVHPDGHSRCEVMRRCIRPAPDMTRMIDRLVRRRLVTRTRDPDDQRVSVAKITSRGLELLERMEPEIVEAVRGAMAPLEPDQLRELSRLCDALVP